MIDASSEADMRYARVIEREYEDLSANLRKWFKKLAVSIIRWLVRLDHLTITHTERRERTRRVCQYSREQN